MLQVGLVHPIYGAEKTSRYSLRRPFYRDYNYTFITGRDPFCRMMVYDGVCSHFKNNTNPRKINHPLAIYLMALGCTYRTHLEMMIIMRVQTTFWSYFSCNPQKFKGWPLAE